MPARRCFALEPDVGYVDATIRRWQKTDWRECCFSERLCPREGSVRYSLRFPAIAFVVSYDRWPGA